MTQNVPTFYPGRVNVRVPSMTYAADVDDQGMCRVQFGALVALDTDAILDGQSISGTSSTTTLASSYDPDNMGPYGRALTVVASGASTSVVTVRGRDYLNQRLQEQLTLNGTTAVAGKKAFKYVDQVDWGSTSGVTIDLGFSNVMGLPYRSKAMSLEMKNDAVAANAGTFTAALAESTTATATNADVRGTYLPVTTIPDGSNTFEIVVAVDDTNLHGNEQYYA